MYDGNLRTVFLSSRPIELILRAKVIDRLVILHQWSLLRSVGDSLDDLKTRTSAKSTYRLTVPREWDLTRHFEIVMQYRVKRTSDCRSIVRDFERGASFEPYVNNTDHGF